MDELVDSLKICAATTFSFYLKNHFFHFNVEGLNFPQYHTFFEKIYTDAWEAFDTLSELIRTLQAYAPGSFKRFKEISRIKDQENVPSLINMLAITLDDTEVLIEELRKAERLAAKEDYLGISNVLQDRINIHNKYLWQIKSTLKGMK